MKRDDGAIAKRMKEFKGDDSDKPKLSERLLNYLAYSERPEGIRYTVTYMAKGGKT